MPDQQKQQRFRAEFVTSTTGDTEFEPVDPEAMKEHIEYALEQYYQPDVSFKVVRIVEILTPEREAA